MMHEEPRQSLRDAVRTVGADSVYAPNGQGADYDMEDDLTLASQAAWNEYYETERWTERVAREVSEEMSEPPACRWHPDRNGEYRVAPRSDVPLCDECWSQDRQGF